MRASLKFLAVSGLSAVTECEEHILKIIQSPFGIGLQWSPFLQSPSLPTSALQRMTDLLLLP